MAALLGGVQALDQVQRRLLGSSQAVSSVAAVLEPDLIYATIGAPIAELNSISGARLTEDDADARIDRALAWFRDRGMPPGWSIGPDDTPADLGERLARRGLVKTIDGMPGMVLDLTGVRPEPLPPGLSVARVQDEAGFRESCAVLALGFEAPAEFAQYFWPFAELGFGDENPQRVFLARRDGKAVATALACEAGSALGIFNVATLPDVRRQGVGRAITLAALLGGATRGCRMAVLQASPLGHSVYERLGFVDFATYDMWTYPREDAIVV